MLNVVSTSCAGTPPAPNAFICCACARPAASTAKSISTLSAARSRCAAEVPLPDATGGSCSAMRTACTMCTTRSRDARSNSTCASPASASACRTAALLAVATSLGPAVEP